MQWGILSSTRCRRAGLAPRAQDFGGNLADAAFPRINRVGALLGLLSSQLKPAHPGNMETRMEQKGQGYLDWALPPEVTLGSTLTQRWGSPDLHLHAGEVCVLSAQHLDLQPLSRGLLRSSLLALVLKQPHPHQDLCVASSSLKTRGRRMTINTCFPESLVTAAASGMEQIRTGPTHITGQDFTLRCQKHQPMAGVD